MKPPTIIVTSALVALGALAFAQQAAPTPSTPPSKPAQPDAPANPMDAMGARLMEGLKNTEGCYGVNAGRWQSGHQTITAWFENKAAVERWYNSPTHAFTMGALGSRPKPNPMPGVPDDVPIMVMATMKMGGENAIPGPLPVSMFSVELYTPLEGGAMVNERLAPLDFPIAGMSGVPEDGGAGDADGG